MYLVVVGIRRIAGRDESEQIRHRRTARRLYRQGVIVNVFNPKTALFFLAFRRVRRPLVDPPGRVARAVRGVAFASDCLSRCSPACAARLAAAIAERGPSLPLRRHLRRAGSHRSGGAPQHMTRVPLLADARIVVAEPGPDDVVLRPPPQRDVLHDVPQAVRDALAFPLAGEPIDRLVTRGGTATLVIEQPSLPIPSATLGPRHLAVAAAADELERLGVARLTIVVAGGLFRRTSPRDIGLLFPPEFRRRFRGRIIVHDAEAGGSRRARRGGRIPLRVNRALVDTDPVLPVTAAETVVDGGPGALRRHRPRVARAASVVTVAPRRRADRRAGARTRGRAPAAGSSR